MFRPRSGVHWIVLAGGQVLGYTIRATPLLIAVALIGFAAGGCGSSSADGAEPSATAEATIEPTATPTPTPTAEPTSEVANNYLACLADTRRRPELTWIADKTRPLPDGYVPEDLIVLGNHLVVPGYEGRLLDAEAAGHFEELVEAAAEAGFDIRARSTYRSYDEQVWTFAYWIEQLGQVEAERVSAKPGHSEHQMGTTADVTTPTVGWELSESLGGTDEGIWLLENAYRYGFAESYPVDGEETTGYAYEPWHLRYLGVACATSWHDSGLTPVEFLESLGEQG